MKYLLFLIFLTLGLNPVSAREVLLVVGLEGEDEYREVFEKSVENWVEACEKAGVSCEKIDRSSKPSPKAKLENRLAQVGSNELWVVLIGHGTFDGREAKFNVAGDDFSAREFGEWCREITGNLVVINFSSASSPFLSELAGENRTVITATKSANEIFYARFGEYFSEAIPGIENADLDNDEQVSLLEAFLHASARVKEFYGNEGRLATEHALIDDNGDGLGTRSEWFEGTSAVRVARDGAEPDGLRAMQQVLVMNDLEKNFPPELRDQRDKLEREVRLLRRKKQDLDEEEYYKDLENYLRQLALIYEKVGTGKGDEP